MKEVQQEIARDKEHSIKAEKKNLHKEPHEVVVNPSEELPVIDEQPPIRLRGSRKVEEGEG